MRLLRLLKETEVEAHVTISPYLLYPDIPQVGLPKSQLNNKFKKIPSKLKEEATEEGIAFNFKKSSHVPNTLLAHVITEIADSDSVIDLNTDLFEAYFVNGINIGELSEIDHILSRYEIEPDHVSEIYAERSAQIIAHVNESKYAGISAVPSFILNDNPQPVTGVLPSHMWRTFLSRYK